MTDVHVMGATDEAATELRGAGVGRRFLATVVDIVVIALLAMVWVRAFGEPGTCDGNLNMSFTAGDETRSVCGGMAGVYILLVLGYYVVLEKLLGATLGKLLLGLRVRRTADAATISWGQSVVRTLLRVVDGLLVYLVAAIAVWVSPSNQRLGDMAAKTVVVRTRDLPG